jgi:alkylhydroperoxidase/carboxymuconolactone decarboxylase family protein YurZ
MASKPSLIRVTTYQFDVEDDLWESWKDTVPRSKNLDTRLRELIKADRDGRVLDADHDGDAPTHAYRDAVDEVVSDESVVDEVAATWDDSDARLQQRREAAEAAVRLAKERGQLGKQTAVDELLPKYAVDGQNDETWWRRNIREVLAEIGTYSRSEAAYVVEPEA